MGKREENLIKSRLDIRLHNGRKQSLYIGQELLNKAINVYGTKTAVNVMIKSFVIQNYSSKKWFHLENKSEVVQEWLKGELYDA